jgi:peptide-methionine (S)-S-oxide reductase
MTMPVSKPGDIMGARILDGEMEREKATFAGGCFWGVEHLFNEVPGVIEAVSGYAGGHVDKPSYEQVCGGRTGHAEAVEVTYDPSKVTYEQLLNSFWNMHDPTTLNRQGPDTGHQYRSVIFFHTPQQEDAARRSKEEAQKSFDHRIVTEIIPATQFCLAEEYHQRYFQKHPGHYSCHFIRGWVPQEPAEAKQV